MTDTKRGTRASDPYRRDPPTIDLRAGEFTSSARAGDEGATAELDLTTVRVRLPEG